VQKTDDQHDPPLQLIACIAAAFVIMAVFYGSVVTLAAVEQRPP
jgi:hypothetical protein